MRFAGILSKKGDAKRYPFFSNFWWLLFLIVLLSPEPFLDPTIYFVSVLAFTAAWLFAVVEFDTPIASEDDLLAIRGRIEHFSEDINARLRKEGFEVPETTPEKLDEFRTSVTPQTVRTLGRSIFNYGALLVSQRAIFAAIASLVGLVWGPALARVHLFYWSPVAVLYALTFPYVVLMIVMVLPIIVIRYYITRIYGRSRNFARHDHEISPVRQRLSRL